MHSLLLSAILPVAAAWPAAMGMVNTKSNLNKRAVYPTVPPPNFSSGRDNCGAHGPCVVFDAQDQFVDVRPGSGHEFVAPVSGDLRGQCPGLNAAANHGFLPHNGIVTIAQSKPAVPAALSSD